ncbi:MAG: efflux RND transporter periplasmic adaptor subunit, partial [Rickettsiales bacterium]|nr:efflux RND transporter periplasmic adaptor subunit [Rickettsiales bacterium]
MHAGKHTLRNGIILASLLAVIAIIGGMIWYRSDRVAVVQPVHGPAVQAVYATGTVEAAVMMPIAPRVTARLKKLHVDEGSQVTKDQLLAELEDQDLQQVLKELQVRESFAREDYERKKSLYAQHVISETTYDKARTDWQAAQAAVARAEAESDFTKLIAPADGRIIRRDGEEGQLIPANQAIFWLTCCSELRISAEVDEEDIALVKAGQEVLIRADAFPEQTFKGTVQSITPKGDAVARSYRVRIGFAEDTPLMIGMTAETNIIIRETKDALLIPSVAVSRNTVWLVQ